MPTSRRNFLISSVLLAPVRRLTAAAAPNMRFPTGARERLAVASWSFREHLDTAENRAQKTHGNLMALKDFPAMVAQRYNIHNVEILGQHMPSTSPAYLKELRAAVQRAGSHVVDLPAGGDASLYDPDQKKRAAAVEDGKKWIDVASALDCPSVRLNISGAKGVKPDVALTAEGLGAIAQYGASKNVVVNLENDDPEVEDAFFIVKVIDRVNSPWLRALPDFCNSMLKGDEKFNYDAVTAMFQRAYNIAHLKDSEVDNGKVYRVDLARTFAIAKASGFKGYYSAEFEGEGDAYAGVAKLIDAGLKYLS
ncbi:MAG: sugar phosphate isomerase/epimerase family protein [Bryobacteraceae bacterium]|jgi:sugar phosphate isomerase/epimerase